MKLIDRTAIGYCGLCYGPVYRERLLSCVKAGVEHFRYQIVCDGCKAKPPQKQFAFATNGDPRTDYVEKTIQHEASN